VCSAAFEISELGRLAACLSHFEDSKCGCGGINAKARRRKDAVEEFDEIRRYPPFFFASLCLRALALKTSIFQVVDFHEIA
jgi:hypothetical protein